MTLSRHPSSPTKPYVHWRRKLAIQLEQLSAVPAEVLKERQVQELRRRMDGVKPTWNRNK
jgi:hypothetical protein